MKKYKIFLAALLLTFNSNWGLSFSFQLNPILTSTLEKNQNINPNVFIYEDIEGTQTISSIKNINNNSWKKIGENLNPDATYWGNFELENNGIENQNYILNLGANNFVNLYLYVGDQLIEHKQGGEFVPSKFRDIKKGRKDALFQISILPEVTYSVYFSIKNITNYKPKIDVQFFNKETWDKQNSIHSFLQAFYQGFLSVVILLTICLYTINRHKAYIYFGLYTFFLAVYFLWFKGLIHEFILPNSPELSIYILLTVSVLPILYLQFMRHFLQTKVLIPKWDRVTLYLIKTGVILMIIEFAIMLILFDVYLIVLATNMYLMLVSLFIMVICVKLYSIQDQLAKFFILGSLLFVMFTFFGLILYLSLGWSLALYFIQFGNIVELILFSSGLGYRIYIIYKSEKEISETAINQLEKNKDLEHTLSLELGKELDKKNIELQESVVQLESSNNELQRFSYVISHDLKAPLRGIANLSQFIKEDFSPKLNESGIKMIDLLHERIGKLEKLIDGVLHYSKITNSDKKFEIENSKNIAEKAIQILPITDEIEIKFDTAMPELKCESIQLQQVFQNLIDNAIKSNSKGKVLINIGSIDEGEKWKFYVKDNGEGIPEQSQQKIFEIFQTSGRKNQKNTGVGLAIVKKIVQLHGGDIHVESEKGVGSTFFFTIKKKLK